MFNLMKTFEKEGLTITPIMMEGEPIFLPQEIESQMGFSDLAHSISNSDGLLENVDYRAIAGPELKELKALVFRSNTALQIPEKAHRLTVLTESGFYAMSFRSNKPECMKFRVFVTSEVLTKIRKTGAYASKKKPLDIGKVERMYTKTKRLGLETGMTIFAARKRAADTVLDQLGVDIYELLGIQEVSSVPEEEDQKMERLFAAWLKRFGDEPITIKVVVEVAERERGELKDAIDDLARGQKMSSIRRFLGTLFRGNHRVKRDGKKSKHGAMWTVVSKTMDLETKDRPELN